MIDRVCALFLVGPMFSMAACGAAPAGPAGGSEVVVAAVPGATSAPGEAAAPGGPTASKNGDDAKQATEPAELEMLTLQALGTLEVPTNVLTVDDVSVLDAAAAGPKGGSGGVFGGVATGAGPGGGSVGGAGGAGAKVTGPAATATMALEGASGGAVANATAVTAAMSAGMRRCYAAALAKDPASPAGSMQFDVAVGSNGEVSSVVPKNTTTVASRVVACAKARIAAAHFSPPASGSAKLEIRVTVDRSP